MNLTQARNEVMALARAGVAPILKSSPGIGKSQMIYSLFEEIRDTDAAKGISWGFGTIFAATQTPADLIGYQFKGNRDFVVGKDAEGKDIVRNITVTEPSIPLWMLDSATGKPAFLFDKFFLLIDEYGQGEADVKRATAEIFLNGGTAPWYLPPGSVRIAATNEGTKNGVSKDFDFCIARRAELTIEGDVDVWLNYADKPYNFQGVTWQTTPVIKAWAKQHPEVLFEAAPEKQGPFCNPRQLCAVDRYLQVKWAQQGNQDIDPTSTSTIAGMIGMGAAMSLLGTLQFMLELPSYAEVIADPANTPVPGRADLQMLMAYQMAGYTKVQDLGPCIQYVSRLPKDMGVTYISSLLRRDYKGIINQPAMQAWINKNAALVSVIASLSQ